MGAHGEGCDCPNGDIAHLITPAKWHALRGNPFLSIVLTDDGHTADFTRATAALYSTRSLPAMILYTMALTAALNEPAWEPAWMDLLLNEEPWDTDIERELAMLESFKIVRALFAAHTPIEDAEAAHAATTAITAACYDPDNRQQAWMIAFLVADLCAGTLRKLSHVGRYTVRYLTDRALTQGAVPPLLNPPAAAAIAQITAALDSDGDFAGTWNGYAERTSSYLVVELLINELARMAVPGFPPALVKFDDDGIPSAISTPETLPDTPEARPTAIAVRWITQVADGIPLAMPDALDEVGDDLAAVALVLARSFAVQMGQDHATLEAHPDHQH